MRSCSNIVGIYMISWYNINEKKALSQFPALRTGDCENAFFALLFTYSLFWHMHWLARRKTNDKIQLSASFPWGLKKPKKTTKNKNKKPKTCPQCLQSLEIFFFVFVFCLFRPLWPILAYLGMLWPIVALWWCENTARGKHCKTLQGKQCKTHGRTASFSEYYMFIMILYIYMILCKYTGCNYWYLILGLVPSPQYHPKREELPQLALPATSHEEE